MKSCVKCLIGLIFLTILSNSEIFALNQALYFDGNNDYVATGNIGNISDKTISAWVKLNNLTQFGGGLVTIETSDGIFFDAIVYNETFQGWGFGSNVYSRSAWSSIVETSTDWIHLAATYQDNDYRLYRNGVLICSTNLYTVFNFLAINNPRILIGKRHTGGGNAYLNATIDNVCVWNYALSQAEIINEMRSQITGNEPGLVAYYNMNSTSDLIYTVEDNSNNSNTGTKYDGTDNVGIGPVVVNAADRPVPTLTEWAVIIFISMLAIIGGCIIWRRIF